MTSAGARQGWQRWLAIATARTDATGNANMRQLVTLRWIAVAGQFVTIDRKSVV